MQDKIDVIKADYADLVAQVQGLDATLMVVAAREEAKRGQLAERKALLAERMRSAYDTDRTSLLESFLSGGTFTDLLAEMSDYIDVGEQDKALADQITHDQETLASLHQTTEDTRARMDDLRLQTAAQKGRSTRAWPRSRRPRPSSRRSRSGSRASLAQPEEATTRRSHGTRRAAKKALAKAAAAKKKLQSPDRLLIAKQMQQGNIPSQYNGTLQWPMAGDVTQHVRVHRVLVGAPATGRCAHFHQGIDIVAPYGTPVRASGDGVVVYIGWNYADGADPAWIVIIAHSQGLQTWYAHMSPQYPGGIHAGSQVSAGQVIGYEGDTGHSTGAHLHWAVMLNGNFVNPRLFL